MYTRTKHIVYAILKFTYIPDIDECVSRPCKHGGICNDELNKYTCTCANGYTGISCETGKLFVYVMLRITILEQSNVPLWFWL